MTAGNDAPVFRPVVEPPLPPGDPLTFLGARRTLRVGELVLAAPMIYAGAGDAAAVDPVLKVSFAEPASPLPFPPDYRRASPAQRGALLRWWAERRRSPWVDRGVVWLGLYMLERRTLVDAADFDWASRELWQWRRIYGAADEALRDRIDALLGALALRRPAELDEPAALRLLELGPAALPALAAWFHHHRRPLPAAAAYALADASAPARRPAEADREAHRARFEAEWPGGLELPADLETQTRSYEPAHPALAARAFPARAPDVRSLTQRLRAAWEAALDG